MAVIFGVAGIVLIFGAFAFNGWWIERQWERRHNHRYDRFSCTAAQYEAAVQAARRPPLDQQNVELWARQIMAADTDTLIREATR